MARMVLGVTGSVAAIRTPASRRTHGIGHEVRVVATEPALYFFDPAELTRPRRPAQTIDGRRGLLFRDRDEWPGSRYQRGDPVLHIEFRNWAEPACRRPARRQHAGQVRAWGCATTSSPACSAPGISPSP